MGHDWIIDVLADLKRFANTNELHMLAAQLENTALVASSEIAATRDTASLMNRGDCADTRQLSGTIGASRRV